MSFFGAIQNKLNDWSGGSYLRWEESNFLDVINRAGLEALYDGAKEAVKEDMKSGERFEIVKGLMEKGVLKASDQEFFMRLTQPVQEALPKIPHILPHSISTVGAADAISIGPVIKTAGAAVLLAGVMYLAKEGLAYVKDLADEHEALAFKKTQPAEARPVRARKNVLSTTIKAEVPAARKRPATRRQKVDLIIEETNTVTVTKKRRVKITKGAK